MYSVYGIGNPLMDIIAFRDYKFRDSLGKPPGSMNLIDAEESKALLARVNKDSRETGMVAGGSCANTIRGLAWLEKIKLEKNSIKHEEPTGSAFVYSGAVGNDRLGNDYISLMNNYGVRTEITKKNSITGSSIIIVTPDHERTMFTHLGACREFAEGDVNFDILKNSRYLYFLGFMWDTASQKNAVKKAVEFAKQSGIKVCFDLAGPFVVKRYRDEFLSWLPGNVDILLGNREEFRNLASGNSYEGSYEDTDDRTVLKLLNNLSPLLVLKKGKEGCIIAENYFSGGSLSTKYTNLQGEVVQAKDTTGAGDAFSAGLLYGLLKNKGIVYAAEFANYLASQIVTVPGCDYEALESSSVLLRASL